MNLEAELFTLQDSNSKLVAALHEANANVEQWKKQLTAYQEETERLRDQVSLREFEDALMKCVHPEVSPIRMFFFLLKAVITISKHWDPPSQCLLHLKKLGKKWCFAELMQQEIWINSGTPAACHAPISPHVPV